MGVLRSVWLAYALLGVALGIVHSDTIPKYLANYGIQVEEHSVTTKDGYIMGVFRLPRKGAPVVMFQHGILSSAWCWIDNEPSLSPALQAYNTGYDVWLTNNRGNMFSKKHTSLRPFLDKQFWDFSFQTMGWYDVPANIDYILSQTGESSLTYFGHSMGTSQFFSAMSNTTMKADLEKKVNLFVAVAPVAYLSHQTSLLLGLATKLDIGALLELTYPFGLLDWSGLSDFADFLCKATAGKLCKVGVDTICGVSNQDTDKAITNISAHFPAGTSVKALEHYEQLIDNKKFQEYDYGKSENTKRYGSDTPPLIDLTQAGVPTALFIGGHDDLGDPTDAEIAAAELPKSTVVFQQTFPGFSHITWIAGTPSAFQAWFPHAKALLQKYNPVSGGVLV